MEQSKPTLSQIITMYGDARRDEGHSTFKDLSQGLLNEITEKLYVKDKTVRFVLEVVTKSPALIGEVETTVVADNGVAITAVFYNGAPHTEPQAFTQNIHVEVFCLGSKKFSVKTHLVDAPLAAISAKLKSSVLDVNVIGDDYGWITSEFNALFNKTQKANWNE